MNAPMPGNVVDHEAAQRALFWARENDSREAKHPPRDTAEIQTLRAAFRASVKEWDKTANGGKGAWRNPVARRVEEARSFTEPNPTGLDRTEVNGRIVNLPDFEDSVDFAIEHAPSVVEAEEIQRAAADLFEDRTGEVIAEDLYVTLRDRNAELLRNSHSIAAKLQSVGVDGYTGGEFGMWLFDLVRFAHDPNYGRHAIEQAKFRRCNFIPVIAQQKRRFVVKLLEFWLEKHRHARFWTFTSGERCTVADLRERIQYLNRKISRLNAEQFMRDAGVAIVFRATETGSLVDDEGKEQKNAEGQWLYHPHSHCLVEMTKGRISRHRWSALMCKVWDFMDNNWDDGGQIDSVRECAKYPMKPTDVARLSPDETKQLFTALQGLHLVQPLGSVKALKVEIKEAGQTLLLQRSEEGLKLIRTTNPNRHLKRPEKSEEDKQVEKILSWDDSEHEGAPKTIATLAPGPFFDRVMRPAVLVCAKTFNINYMQDICKQPYNAALIEKAMPSYLAGLQLLKSEAAAAAIRVHTYPVTVRNGSAENPDQKEFSAMMAGQLSPPGPQPDEIPT